MDSQRGIEVSSKSKIVIVGGVASGASCATRARRLSEDAEIIILEKGPYVSFASCGLPYYIGDVITNEDDLLVATSELFKNRFNIDVRVNNEVLAIDRERQELEVRDCITGAVYHESYSSLVLATGTTPIKPALPGIELDGIYTLKTISDSERVRECVGTEAVKQAVVIGGGFIGLETAENLAKRGVSVTVLEMLPQVMSQLDPEMAEPVQKHLVANGITLHLGDGVTGFARDPITKQVEVITKSGKSLSCDLVLLSIGVRPEVALAKKAGLEIGKLGGIRVTDQMRTDDKHIWAVGDATEVKDFVTGNWALYPLAGPASRQGRIAADAILRHDSHFRGAQATSVCSVFNLTVAMTGISEKTLARLKGNGQEIKYEKVYMHPGSHASYYPGAKPMKLKLLFETKTGRILGAQGVGEEGVERRIDVISMVIQKNGSVFDLEESEMCYAPQFGSARDPLNIAGMIASNALRGDSPLAHWDAIDQEDIFIVDVREPDEFCKKHISGAENIPLPALRSEMGKLPRNKEILVYCRSGQRSYYASRILRLNGFSARNISGGMLTYDTLKHLDIDHGCSTDSQV